MSSAAGPENKWRSGAPKSRPQGPPSSGRGSGASTPQDGPKANNVWGQKDKDNKQQGDKSPKVSAQYEGEKHVPLKGFNSGEVNDALLRGYQESMKSGSGGKPALYKPQSESKSSRSSGVWGAKPNTMANGQDFWVQLKKQIQSLEQQSKS